MNTSRTATATLALLAALGLALAGCSGTSSPATPGTAGADTSAAQDTPTPTPQPVDLSGEWEQSNKNSEDNYQAATITGDTIEINWISNGGDTRSLYWAGTVTVPTDGSQTFTFESVNDTSKTENAILASSDDTKTFTYDNGELSYEVSALGVTTTVRLAKK